ncbi:hypothetical protein RP726_13210 [Candidatus Methylospira mobilis]|uniref:hypothetical protein n=1 Tax=Candidatus Methylospira mobilis TaxID=1808979 RepID=UPI0028EC810E|nr:hypothetical protein [Candidatus Methylospira mobilis]WNV03409.1 hypothetical protein RP726_13210 [Candidatus Methylospira mobilis]
MQRPHILSFPGTGAERAQAAKSFRYPDIHLPDEVIVKVHMQAIGRDVLNEPVKLNYLEEDDRNQVPVLALNAETLRFSDKRACKCSRLTDVEGYFSSLPSSEGSCCSTRGYFHAG